MTEYLPNVIGGLVFSLLIGVMLRGHYGAVQKKLDNLDKTYVRRDVCHEKTDNMQNDITEIKTDVKEILRRNGGLK